MSAHEHPAFASAATARAPLGLGQADRARLGRVAAGLDDAAVRLALAVIGSLLVCSATRNRTELNQGDP